MYIVDVFSKLSDKLRDAIMKLGGFSKDTKVAESEEGNYALCTADGENHKEWTKMEKAVMDSMRFRYY